MSAGVTGGGVQALPDGECRHYRRGQAPVLPEGASADVT